MKLMLSQLLRNFGYHTVISALIDACREQADLELGRNDNEALVFIWEMRAQALENLK